MKPMGFGFGLAGLLLASTFAPGCSHPTTDRDMAAATRAEDAARRAEAAASRVDTAASRAEAAADRTERMVSRSEPSSRSSGTYR